MKFLYLLIVLAGIISCQNRNESDAKVAPNTINKSVFKDTIIFDHIVYIDTINCYQFRLGRTPKDTLLNEYCVVRENSVDTFLSTTKYQKLWLCNKPLLKLNVNDTILVSGIIYSIGGSESVPGWPTVLYQIRLKK